MIKTFSKMDYLPHDAAMLVSTVNMFLRDEEYDSIESLCYAFDRNVDEMKSSLADNGYVYCEAQKQFRPIGFDQ